MGNYGWRLKPDFRKVDLPDTLNSNSVYKSLDIRMYVELPDSEDIDNVHKLKSFAGVRIITLFYMNANTCTYYIVK